jgi:hypothetical protein
MERHFHCRFWLRGVGRTDGEFGKIPAHRWTLRD